MPSTPTHDRDHPSKTRVFYYVAHMNVNRVREHTRLLILICDAASSCLQSKHISKLLGGCVLLCFIACFDPASNCSLPPAQYHSFFHSNDNLVRTAHATAERVMQNARIELRIYFSAGEVQEVTNNPRTLCNAGKEGRRHDIPPIAPPVIR